MLEAQCASWGGIISATVYWPRFVSNASEHSAEAQQAAFDAARQQLAALHAQMESRGVIQRHGRPDCSRRIGDTRFLVLLKQLGCSAAVHCEVDCLH